MFVEQSSFRQTTRIRVMEQILAGGKWKRRLVQHVGTAHNDLERDLILGRAREIVETKRHPGQIPLAYASGNALRMHAKAVGEYWEGAELVLGTLFDAFAVPMRASDLRLFRNLVIARVMNPVSKRRTADWLSRCLHVTYNEDEIYRFMDRLHAKKQQVTSGMRQFITTRYPQSLQYLLYDVTSVYWESDDEDVDVAETVGLRKRGYSKDHREDLPQIVLGLVVNTLGMPLDCHLYSGDTYEGKTLLTGVNAARKAIGLNDVTIVADAGMLSDDNLRQLETDNRFYIVGARLKNLTRARQQIVLAHDYDTQPVWEFPVRNRRLVISYSAKRAKRAAHSREQSVARLQRLLAQNRAVRKHRFLDFTIAENPRLNQEAITEAARWDGIKGYVTNNPNLSADEVIARYGELYRVEQSFRMSKSDLKIRPAYHHVRERIEAHVLICMVSLCLMRVLEETIRPIGMTVGEGLRTLESAKGAILALKGKSYTVPPLYSPAMESIFGTLRSGGLSVEKF